jgi:ribulose 1,5-bisphosphate synthetase/thiazole synthase
MKEVSDSIAKTGNLSRRDFLKGAGVTAGAVAAGGALVACSATGETDKGAAGEQIKWDRETEVLVLGFGGAGAISAIAAFEEGAEVLIIEKAPKEGGGTTRISTGYSSTVVDVDQAVAYLHHQVKGLTPDSVFQAYAEEGATLMDWLDDHDLGYVDLTGMLGSDYKNWPGADGFGAVGFTDDEGWTSGTVFYEWAKAYMQDNNIEIVFDSAAYKLVQDPATKEVLGVLAKHSDGSETCFRAKKAVILCTGGFECNDEMIGNYLVPSPLAREGWKFNTGDGIKMAQEIGADLWHMNMLDAYGVTFTAPGEITGRFGLNGATCTTGSFMWINRKGERFLCENPSNIGNPLGHRCVNLFARFDDTPGALPQGYDSSYRDIPFYLLIDQKQFSAGPLYDNNQTAGCGLIDKELGGVDPWSEDNSEELAKGWILKGDTIEEIVAKMNENSKDEGFHMDPAALQATIATYNADCATGIDTQIGRPAVVNNIPNLVALDTPPYYALRLMPCMNTTKGGPVKNEKAQILNVKGEVIPRLYEAGTLGHTAAQVYCVFGANLAECFNFGRIAGRNAAAETPLA